MLQRPAKLDSRVPTSLQDEITELDNPSSIKESAHQLQATNRNHQLKVGNQIDNSANPEIGKPLVNPAVEVSQTLSEVEGDNPLEEPNLAQYQMQADVISSFPSVLNLIVDLRDICTAEAPETSHRHWLSFIK